MSDYPSLSDIIEALKQLSPPRGSDRAKAKDKLLDRLESLRALLPGLDVQRSRDFRKLMDRSIILDVSDVKDVALPVLFTFLVTLLREVYRSESVRGITRLLVMEESHLLMGGQTDRRTSDLKESTPSGVLRDLRKSGGGTCGVVVSQLIQDASPSVRGNLGSTFVLRQGHRDGVRHAAGMLNLEAWREPEIAKLPNRHAIARLSRYGDPVYLVVKDARALGIGVSPKPSREEARERSRPILEAIPYVKGGEPAVAVAGAGGTGAGGPAADGSGKGTVGPVADGKGSAGPAAADDKLRPREMRMFARICERPWELIIDRAEALGIDRDSEGEERNRLGARGLIACAGKIGSRSLLYELTARGRAVAEKLGLSIAESGKGHLEHQSAVENAQLHIGRYSSKFTFKRVGISSTTAGVRPDLLVITPDGGRVPIQACVRNQPAYEADALMKLHDLALLEPDDADKVDFVLAIAVNKHHKAAIERALKDKNNGKMPDKVILLDFDAIVKTGFDWSVVFPLPF